MLGITKFPKWTPCWVRVWSPQCSWTLPMHSQNLISRESDTESRSSKSPKDHSSSLRTHPVLIMPRLLEELTSLSKESVLLRILSLIMCCSNLWQQSSVTQPFRHLFYRKMTRSTHTPSLALLLTAFLPSINCLDFQWTTLMRSRLWHSKSLSLLTQI